MNILLNQLFNKRLTLVSVIDWEIQVLQHRDRFLFFKKDNIISSNSAVKSQSQRTLQRVTNVSLALTVPKDAKVT